MSACDIIVLVAISVAFLAVVGVILYKKATHKGGGCGCGCEGCPHARNCKSGENKPSEPKK